MISIIVLYRNDDYLDQLKESVEKTIGVNYELIKLDNKENKYNIFQGYNIGVSKSSFPILCFCHEDILFRSNDWGKNVINHFESDAKIGLLGTVGGNAFPACPAPWWNNVLINDHLANNINSWPGKKSIHDYKNPTGKNIIEGVAVDGFWFCIRKNLFEQIKFDEKRFDGFHCYDTDICLQVIQAQFSVNIIFDVLIEHFSPGTINQSWIDSTQILANKWKTQLPIFKKKVDPGLAIEWHYKCLLTYAYWMKSLKYKDREIIKVIKKYSSNISIPHPKTWEWLLLLLWKNFGYSFSRIPFKFFKLLIRAPSKSG